MKTLIAISLMLFAFPSFGQTGTEGYNKYTAPDDTRAQQEQERRRVQAEALRRERQNALNRGDTAAQRAADDVRSAAGSCRLETNMIGEVTRCRVCPGEPTVCWKP